MRTFPFFIPGNPTLQQFFLRFGGKVFHHSFQMFGFIIIQKKPASFAPNDIRGFELLVGEVLVEAHPRTCKWLGSPPHLEAMNGQLEGEQLYLGYLLTMISNHLPNGMILQVTILIQYPYLSRRKLNPDDITFFGSAIPKLNQHFKWHLLGWGGVDPTQSLTTKIIFWRFFFTDATSATSSFRPWEVAPWWIRGDCPASLFRVDLPDPDDLPPGAIRKKPRFRLPVENLGCGMCQVKSSEDTWIGIPKKNGVLLANLHTQHLYLTLVIFVEDDYWISPKVFPGFPSSQWFGFKFVWRAGWLFKPLWV